MTRPLAYFLHILAALSPVPALARTVLVLSARSEAAEDAADIQRGRADSLEAQLAACARAREQLAAELELLRRQITAVRAEDDDNAALADKDLQIQEYEL